MRIRRFYQALGEVRTTGTSSIQPRVEVVGNRVNYTLDFSGGASDAKLANVAGQLIENIACLRDYLNAWCKKNGKPIIGDAIINSNLDVAIIHDLWNLDKHFELDRPPRCRLNLELRDIHRGAHLTTQAKAGSFMAIGIDPHTGQPVAIGDGKVELIVDADVMEKAGKRIGGLLEIAERAITVWEKAFTDVGVVLPAR
ncbi:MAG TPA: hypothetical protein VGQ99_20785 [Tepidisphaeraceae bacterium]|nr:hypothetical protein [Tepidisphaeraceae bacterium]